MSLYLCLEVVVRLCAEGMVFFSVGCRGRGGFFDQKNLIVMLVMHWMSGAMTVVKFFFLWLGETVTCITGRVRGQRYHLAPPRWYPYNGDCAAGAFFLALLVGALCRILCIP